MRTEARVARGEDLERAEPAADGFEQFFRTQYPVVVRIASAVVRDAHLAEDVAQDVFIAAEQRFAAGGDLEHAAAWVRIAATHLGLNAIRGRRRRDARHRRQLTGLAAPGPEDLVVDRESGALVRAALGRLARHQATVLVLRHSGLSYAEVAEAMDVKVGQVGTMLRRAEAALRKEIDRATRS
ncbi:MAG TPA: sigma-70 family RNA polymerase sigma factor [Acidimicrobiales bacterium]|nr:sigma-70 family RNA polymerase sigma factor [Acidimicrobiales bacterium]